MFNGGTAAAADLGYSSSSAGAAGRDNQRPPTSSTPSQLPIKTAAEALMAGNMMMLGAGSDHDDPIPFQTRTPVATPASHPIINDLISSASSSLSGPNSIPAHHSQLSALPAGFATPPGFPTPIGHSMSPQSTTGFPQSHHPIHASQQHHMLLQQHGLSGSAAYQAFHNAGLSSPLPSAPSTTSSYLGSVMSNPPPPPPQYSPQYAYQQPPHPPQLFQQNQQQQQQQVVVLLPSTAKIDRLQFAQVVDAVSSALQRTVEFKDLLMTVAPTPLVVMEPESLAAGTDLVRPKIDTTEQGIMVSSDTQSVGVATATVERKATETQTATAKCVSIETQTEDSEMLRAIVDKTVDHHNVGGGAMAINEQESVVWFNKSDLANPEQPATATNSSSPSRHRDSSCSWSGSTTATGGPAADDPWGSPIQPQPRFGGWGDEQPSTRPAPASRSASQRPAPRAPTNDPWGGDSSNVTASDPWGGDSSDATANDPWGGDSRDAMTSSSPWPEVPPQVAPQSRSASQRPPPLQASTNAEAHSRAPSQPPALRTQSTSTSNALSVPPSLATSRLGARGLRPSALLTSPPQTPTPTATPTTSTTRTSSPAYFPAGPPRPLPTRPHLSHSPSLPPVPAPEIDHPLTLVTPFRPANCGPAPNHVTLRNLRPSVTPSDLLYLARDLRTLVKVYYPPHAFFSFVGRAAVYFLGDETEAIEFGRWMQGQIQRGKLRVVYELTEADVREAEVRRGLDTDKVRGWQTKLAVTVFRPGSGKRAAARARRSVGREVVDGVERGVRERMATGEREWAERVEEADAMRHEGQGDGEEEGDDEVDAGDWKQWEADMCRLFEDEISAGGGAQQEEDDSAIEWVDHVEIAAMQGKKAVPSREPSVVRNFARMWQETAPDA